MPIEINLNFVLFEELKEKPDGSGATTRIVVMRENKDPGLALEDGAMDFHSLE